MIRPGPVVAILAASTLLPQSLAAQVMGPPDPREAQFNRCLDIAIDDPSSGVANANEWLTTGGSYFARHCLGFAYVRQQRWQAAAIAFAQAANAAQSAGDKRAANLWTQAANAALAGSQFDDALSYIDSALAQGTLTGQMRGEAHLDRARILVAMKRLEDARGDFAQVQKLVPEDPLGWLLSATLERRLDNLERARADIQVALSLGPEDPDILVEAGAIAILSGDLAAARKAWEQVVTINAPGPARVSAQDYLRQLDEMADSEESGEAPASPAAGTGTDTIPDRN
ncbi:MAG: tetratricopeptide repeat protein [Pseudomonadota bacterium]